MTDNNEELKPNNLEDSIPEELEKDLSTDFEYDEDDSGEVVADLGKNFEAPKSADQFIDASKGTVIDKSKLSYLDIITATAKQHGITLRKPNSGCKKCYGRGYEYLTTEGSPHPCSCIQIPRTPLQKSNEEHLNTHIPFLMDRETRRKVERRNRISANKRKSKA